MELEERQREINRLRESIHRDVEERSSGLLYEEEKKLLLIYHSGVIFAEDLLKIKLLCLRLYV